VLETLDLQTFEQVRMMTAAQQEEFDESASQMHEDLACNDFPFQVSQVRHRPFELIANAARSRSAKSIPRSTQLGAQRERTIDRDSFEDAGQETD